MDRLQSAFRHIALFFNGALMAVFGLYFAWMLAILVLKLAGQLADGPMYHDMETPSYAHVIVALLVCGAVIGGCLLFRRKLMRGKAAFTSPN